jgi:hypothetical protein
MLVGSALGEPLLCGLGCSLCCACVPGSPTIGGFGAALADALSRPAGRGPFRRRRRRRRLRGTSVVGSGFGEPLLCVLAWSPCWTWVAESSIVGGLGATLGGSSLACSFGRLSDAGDIGDIPSCKIAVLLNGTTRPAYSKLHGEGADDAVQGS